MEIPVRMPRSRMPIHRQESLNGLNCQVLSTRWATAVLSALPITSETYRGPQTSRA